MRGLAFRPALVLLLLAPPAAFAQGRPSGALQSSTPQEQVTFQTAYLEKKHALIAREELKHKLEEKVAAKAGDKAN